MREARIIFPTEPLARERTRFEHDLVQAFGGFTSSDGYGAWANDEGGVIQEQVIIYDIAMDADGAFRLQDLAFEYGRLLGQEAVYVRKPSGEVEIVDMKQKASPVASPAPAAAPYDPADRLNQAEKAFLDRVKDPQGVVRDKTDDWERRKDVNRQAGAQALDALRQQPGGNVGTGERQATPLGAAAWIKAGGSPDTYPGEGESATELATAHAERKLGIKRLPQAGEVWSTGSGGKAAVTGRASIADGGFYVSLLDAGNYAGVSPGYGFTVNLDGKHLRGGDARPLDLKRFLTAF
jgi:hypothetical protein